MATETLMLCNARREMDNKSLGAQQALLALPACLCLQWCVFPRPLTDLAGRGGRKESLMTRLPSFITVIASAWGTEGCHGLNMFACPQTHSLLGRERGGLV